MISPDLVQGESWQHQDMQLPVSQQEHQETLGLVDFFSAA